jgi:hypothetical protein
MDITSVGEALGPANRVQIVFMTHYGTAILRRGHVAAGHNLFQLLVLLIQPTHVEFVRATDPKRIPRAAINLKKKHKMS